MDASLSEGERIHGLQLTPLKRIALPAGDVMHGLRASEPAFGGFGEAYFTSVVQGQVKGWKRHRRMLSNLIVPVGSVRVQVLDDREDSPSRGQWFDASLGEGNYQRLTLPPNLWFAFGGVGAGLNLMLNLASIEHDPSECDSLPLGEPRFAASGW